jgi:hypothetical protein
MASIAVFIRKVPVSLLRRYFASANNPLPESVDWDAPTAKPLLQAIDEMGDDVRATVVNDVQREVQGESADAFAANVLPIIESLRATGVTDLRGLAGALNTRGIRTARGGRWHVSNVKNVLDRTFR